MLTFVEGAIEDIPAVGMEINYILHAASPTDSSYFLEKPVETIQTTLCGMWNVLEVGKKESYRRHGVSFQYGRCTDRIVMKNR